MQNPADGRTKTRPARRPSGAGKSRTSITGERDFVHENIVDAGTHQRPAQQHLDETAFVHKSDYGRVPEYLHERKMELAATYARQQVLLPNRRQANLTLAARSALTAAF